MKYKALGYLFLFVVLAAIVSVIYYQQITGSIPDFFSMPQHRVSQYKTFEDPNGKFEVMYPKEYETGYVEASQLFFASTSNDDAVEFVQLTIPETAFPNTNYVAATLAIAKSNQIKNASDCKKYSNGAAILKTTDKTEVVGENKFDKAEFSGAAAGNLYETKLYRIFHGGICYEVSLILHTTNIGNYEPGTVKEVNEEEAWSKLMQVLNTFKFKTSEVSTKNPQCAGFGGIECPAGLTCVLEGDYPDAGGTCVANKASGVLKGFVQVGPLCGGPVSQDMPCQKKADYSSTKVMVYRYNSPTLLKTISVDSSGNYSVELAAGKYSVKYQTNYGFPYERDAQVVTVISGQATALNFDIDTGMR